MALTYKIHPRHADKAELITIGAGGKPVNLAGRPAVKSHPATPAAAAWEETIPAATQADLKKVYDEKTTDVQGYPLVVASEAKDKAVPETDKK